MDPYVNGVYAGSSSSSTFNNTQQFPSIPLQQTFNSVPHVGPLPEQAIQLELLWETRRIRELELQIAEAGWRETEERRKEREAELALALVKAEGRAQNNLFTSSPWNSSAFANPDSEHPSELSHLALAIILTLGLSHSSLGSHYPTTQERDAVEEYQSEDSPGTQPSAGTTGGTARKRQGKVIQDKNVNCTQCGVLMAKMMLRGSKEELNVPYDMVYRCLECEPSIPSTSTRKRTSEMEDTNAPAICDVCSHMKGHGGFVAKERSTISFTAEMICLSCTEKYKRCTNCGGTSARGVIGKWRCKELFSGGRKTCSLSHARLGTRDMELAVWEIPADLQNTKELPFILECCEQMWREHVLSRLAVPELLEHQDELRTFRDIESKILRIGFPGQELFTQPPRSPNHRRFVSFNWAKLRTRRDKSKPEWAQTSHDTKRQDQWLTYNMRRSTVLYPTNSMLCGVWIVEWVIRGFRFLTGNCSSCKIASRLRLAEGLQRRSFLPLDEYLARHVHAQKEMFRHDVCALAQTLAKRRAKDNEIDVLAMHLGKRCDARGARQEVTRQTSIVDAQGIVDIS
ncbi:hypothetical protein EW146_g5860 [Bondarzewia mesenterica]|uniref:Uncharacterized protein n=1 Tax=Bondarzewia mesenterica TaxID=1095465 RepID=A0A4V3XEP9_9AGAM|nr:hypothetical protein EW146_g5860 [Bondarzewia mesenterica]